MIWTADQNNKHIRQTGCLVRILTAEKFNLINIYVTVCRFICFLSIILQYNHATVFFNSSMLFINFSTACCNLQIYQVVFYQTANLQCVVSFRLATFNIIWSGKINLPVYTSKVNMCGPLNLLYEIQIFLGGRKYYSEDIKYFTFAYESTFWLSPVDF